MDEENQRFSNSEYTKVVVKASQDVRRKWQGNYFFFIYYFFEYFLF